MSRAKIRYRCTECETLYSLFNQAARCHWGIGGVEEVQPNGEVGNTTVIQYTAPMTHDNELPAISLDGFEPPFGQTEYTWGPPVEHNGTPWKDHQYHVEFLSWHYHDYLGTHAYIQVWDYAQQQRAEQRWQYMLLLHRPTWQTNDEGAIVSSTWAWTIRNEYPTHAKNAKVGADIDTWLEAPDYLRFIIE